MAGGDMPGSDLASDKVAVAALGGKVHRWRQAGRAALDLAQIERATEVACGRADQDQRVAIALQREVDRVSGVRDQPDATNHWRRQDRSAAGFVVKRHIARDDWVGEG